jgi:tetratricopeptide (TPR) repeat protein
MRLAGSRLHFKALPPIRVKGASQAMAVFRALADAPQSRFSPAPLSTRMVGRQEERTHLATAVQALAEDGRSGVILIEGEAGIGKSVLVGELLMQAGASGLAFAMGAGSAVERSSAYHAWRPILSRLLGLEGLPDTATRTATLLSRLEALPGRMAWAPLLNGVLPVEVPETDVVRHMPGALRGSNTRELLVQLMEEACRARPCVVVLEDVHWMDSSSWELAARVRHRAAVLLALTTRPVADQHAPEEYRQFRAAPATVYLPLERMPPDDVVAMMCQRFNVRRLPQEVAALIRDKAEGHPFFSEQLVCALRDAGHLVLEEGEYRLVAQSATLAALDLPDTIQGVLNSRLDRLTAQQQLTLKVASVLGRSFSFEVLLSVHPLAQDRATLPEQMEALSRLGFLVLESATPLVYAFKHALVQEAAYGLLAFSQRRELHRAVALHMEEDWEAQRESLLPLLAHHWRQAEAPSQAVGYLERAAEAALSRGANHEAITFLSQAQELAAIHPGAVPVDTLRRIRWHMHLGEAHHRLVEMEPSRTHLHKALRLLGHSLPSSRPGWMARLGWELLRQVAVLVLHRGRQPPPSEERERLALSAHVTSLLAEQQLYTHALLEHITLDLVSVNMAEVAHVYEPASIGYNALAYLVGVARMHRLARLYFRRAQSTREANHGALALLTEGSYHMTFGRWDQGIALQEQSLELAQGVNDRDNQGLARELLGMGLEFSRQPAEAQRVREAMLVVAREGSNPRHQLWALTEMATTLVLLGRLDEVRARLREAEELLPRVDDSMSVMRFRGNAAWSFLHAGDGKRAELHAREMLRMLRGKPQLLWPDITPLGGLAETWQTLWSEARRTGQGDARKFQANAAYACRVLRQLTRLYPIAHPRADRLEGTQAWLEGRTERACKLWRRAILHARTYGMPLEEALAHRALALQASEPAMRAEHLAQARQLFETLGVSERFPSPMSHEEPQAAA